MSRPCVVPPEAEDARSPPSLGTVLLPHLDGQEGWYCFHLVLQAPPSGYHKIEGRSDIGVGAGVYAGEGNTAGGRSVGRKGIHLASDEHIMHSGLIVTQAYDLRVPVAIALVEIGL